MFVNLGKFRATVNLDHISSFLPQEFPAECFCLPVAVADPGNKPVALPPNHRYVTRTIGKHEDKIHPWVFIKEKRVQMDGKLFICSQMRYSVDFFHSNFPAILISLSGTEISLMVNLTSSSVARRICIVRSNCLQDHVIRGSNGG